VSRTGHDRAAERVEHEEVQPLHPRLLALDLVPTALFLAATVALADARLLFLAVGYPLLRWALFTGRHRRRLLVTDRAVVRSPALVPLADVTGIEVVDRATMGRTESGPGHNVLMGPGAGDGLALTRRTPEGLEHVVLVPSRDPSTLAAVIERLRPGAERPALAEAPRPLPLRARQGADPVLASLPLVASVPLDAVTALVFGQPPVLTALWALLVIPFSLRRVEVDEAGVRVGTARFAAEELEAVRLVSRAEALLIPPAMTRRPPWGPPYALTLLVRQRDTGRWAGAPPRRRTVHLSVPAPVDVEPLRRSLPPA
jgi:hypothetical protein